MNNENIEKFWNAYMAIGKEVVAQAVQIGFGFSIIEVKFKDGIPAVVIRSNTEARKYSDDVTAKKELQDIIDSSKFKGSQTFTIVREENGRIVRILLDQYETKFL